jgi:hypothetical protein
VETVLKRIHGHHEVEEMTVKPAHGDACRHHHQKRSCFVVNDDDREMDSKKPGRSRSFRWLPTTTELRNHYIHELGFLASLVQLIGASVFWISGFTGLPGILNNMSENLTDGVYWVPQMVGGSCFVISG